MKKNIKNNSLFFHCVLFILMSLFMSKSTLANVIIHGTRVIYPDSAREVTVRLENKGDKPALIQAWIDDGEKDLSVDKLNTPFIIMPPVFRIEPKNGQTIRISFTSGKTLPKDKESVFWLNVLDIPPKPELENTISKNHVQIAIRSRIKLFYRPGNLSRDGARDAAEKMHWKVAGNSASVTNRSPYFISLSNIIDEQGKTLAQGTMMAPNEDKKLTLSRRVSATEKLKYNYIDDLGARVAVSINP